MKFVQLGALSLQFSGYDASQINVPEAGERLRVRGQNGWYQVVQVDEAHRTCSLVSPLWPEDVITQVPWSDLQQVTCFEDFSVKLMEIE